MESVGTLLRTVYPLMSFFLSKPIDLVPYYILLQDLQSLGFGGLFFNWIEDYLTEGSLHVEVNCTLCEPMEVTSGVPPGSIIRPLLFMNDLPTRISSSTILHMDDVEIKGPSDDLVTLQQSLLSLENWVVKNDMLLNASECKVLSISTSAVKLIIWRLNLFPLPSIKRLGEDYGIEFWAPRPSVGHW